MKFSFKDLIHRKIIENPNIDKGLFFFDKMGLDINLCDSMGNQARCYDDLDDLSLSLTEEEKFFCEKKWQGILESNPSYYDGDVVLVSDIIYDDSEKKLQILFSKAKFSHCIASSDPNYPNPARFSQYLSFGLGVMNNFRIGKNDDLLMVKRSNFGLTERGAISVAGGNVEFKKSTGKDDIRDGLEKASLSELIEEIMSGKTYQDFNIELSSLAWQRKPNGSFALDAYFDVCSRSLIELGDVKKLKAIAEDSKEADDIFKVDVSQNISSKSSDSKLIFPRNLLGQPNLKDSGVFSLVSALYLRMIEDYRAGIYTGLPNNIAGISNYFSGFEAMDIKALRAKLDTKILSIESCDHGLNPRKSQPDKESR